MVKNHKVVAFPHVPLLMVKGPLFVEPNMAAAVLLRLKKISISNYLLGAAAKLIGFWLFSPPE